MISKNKIAYIRSLHSKSTRTQEGIFLVEGRKCMGEFLDSDFEIVEGFFSDGFLSSLSFRHAVEESLLESSYENKNIVISKLQEKGMSTTGQKMPFPHTIISDNELSRITTLTSNDSGVLLVRIRENMAPKIKKDELILILDHINDPGNLGTIIRIADWYGVSQIICSPDTVDCYNPKVLMATMGSFTRVSIYYTDLDRYLSEVEGKIYGAYLDGENTHTKDWGTGGGYLVIGSEAHGISGNLEKYITDRVTIPRFGLAESLNAGVATAVILDRMRG